MIISAYSFVLQGLTVCNCRQKKDLIEGDDMNKSIVVEKLFYDKSVPGVSRVCADVDGDILWYESPDTELVISPEAFANALLGPAMSIGRDIVFEDPLCPVWLKNIPKVIEQYSKWFGWKKIKIESGSNDAPITKTGKLRALCFSGGVDSFYSLLTYPQPIDKLIMVHGYDIDINDTDGGRLAYDHVKPVAAAKGIDAVILKTNLREHHIAGRKYRYTYGGALAAAGFLVSGVNELIISSGFRYDEAQPDGSNWELDPLRSSTEVKIIHYGAELIRDDKLRTIAQNPLLKKHLHVCQQNIRGTFEISGGFLNCGLCIKCNRTLMVLQQEGILDEIEGFTNKKNLDVYLYNTPLVGEYLFKAYDEIIRRGVNKRTELSIRALIRRSRILPKFKWAGKKGQKVVSALLKIYDKIERKLFLYVLHSTDHTALKDIYE